MSNAEDYATHSSPRLKYYRGKVDETEVKIKDAERRLKDLRYDLEIYKWFVRGYTREQYAIVHGLYCSLGKHGIWERYCELTGTAEYDHDLFMALHKEAEKLGHKFKGRWFFSDDDLKEALHNALASLGRTA